MKKIDNGLLIALSGIDGCGKSTTVKSVANIYENRNFAVKTIDIMGETEFARNIKKLIMESDDLSVNTITHLFLAAIEDVSSKIIKPHLEDGYLVICDRHTICTYVYQYIVSGGSVIPIAHPETDINFILDLDPSIAQARITGRKGNNKIDNMPLDFHIEIRNAYKRYAKNHKNKCAIIDANRSTDEISNDIIKNIDFMISRIGTYDE